MPPCSRVWPRRGGREASWWLVLFIKMSYYHCCLKCLAGSRVTHKEIREMMLKWRVGGSGDGVLMFRGTKIKVPFSLSNDVYIFFPSQTNHFLMHTFGPFRAFVPARISSATVISLSLVTFSDPVLPSISHHIFLFTSEIVARHRH